jgi:hypothetical protein
MLPRRSIVALTVVLTFLVAACAAQGTEDRENAKLIEALKGTRVSLESGLSASERRGIPISAEFEIVDGSLELTVYIAHGAELLDVTVDPKTGVIASVEPIADGKEVRLAKGYREAMLKATVSLRVATEQAVKANPGSRAVSIVPMLKDGHPLAEVMLLRGQELKEISVALE